MQLQSGSISREIMQKENLILISEHSKYFAEAYNHLHNSNMDVVQVENVYNVKVGLTMHSPAFILLDFNIKGAKSLLYEIASGQWLPRPYVMVAADYTDSSDRAKMLRLGADICVDWPINAEEVLAVIHAVRRRCRSLPAIVYKELSIDTISRTVTMRGEPIVLTRKEYEVLLLLLNHVGIVLTKEEIYRAVWKSSYDPNSTNVVDQISSLRFKLGLDRKDTTYIQTIIGVGYRFGKPI